MRIKFARKAVFAAALNAFLIRASLRLLLQMLKPVRQTGLPFQGKGRVVGVDPWALPTAKVGAALRAREFGLAEFAPPGKTTSLALVNREELKRGCERQNGHGCRVGVAEASVRPVRFGRP